MKLVLVQVKPIQSKIAAIHRILPPTTKNELMWFNVSKKFLSKFIDESYFSMKLLFDLLHDNSNIFWNFELETLFRQFKTSNKQDVTLTLPITNRPFSITRDSSLIALGFVFSKTMKRGNCLIFSIFLELLLLMNKNSVLHIAN